MCGGAILGPLRYAFFELEVKSFGGTIRHPPVDFTTNTGRKAIERTHSVTRAASMSNGHQAPKMSGLERAGDWGRHAAIIPWHRRRQANPDVAFRPFVGI